MGFFAKITTSQVCKSYHQEMVHFSISHDKRQSNLWYNLDTQDCEASQDKSGTYEVRPVRTSDTTKITTPDQGSQLDPIQWKYYMRTNKRNPSWKRFLQVRKTIYP